MGCDVEAGHALDGGGVTSDTDAAQRAVIDIQHALPQHLQRIEPRGAVIERIVHHCREQIVRGSDRMEIACEVKVDGL